MATTKHPKYIVLAHTPLDYAGDPAFQGEMRFQPVEWVIFDGVHGEMQARGKANTFRKHFYEVQVRTVSDTL